MNKLLIVILLLLSGSFCFAQKIKKKKKHRKHTVVMTTTTPTQLCGTVVLKAGNYMPSPDRPTPKAEGVVRELSIYELTNTKQCEQQDRFYKNLKTKLIKTVKSDKNGAFCVALPEGMYSVFSMEEGKGLFANGFDEAMNIFPITIKKGETTQITFTIDYMATY